MKTIEERAKEYVLNAINSVELPARGWGFSANKLWGAYIAGATDQKAIDIEKAKNAFMSVCDWFSTYAWYNEAVEKFMKIMEEEL